MASTKPALPLELIIRFSTSEPDQLLSLLDSQKTSGLALKQHIRAKLSATASGSRLRLIHAGKVIADNDALSKSLGTLSAPPGRDGSAAKSEKAKGKLPVKDTRAVPRVYIHCSIGDTLSSAELVEEARKAGEADAALLSDEPAKAGTTSTGEHKESVQDGQTTTPAPQGFDRLLSAGFTPAEVANLRAQLLAIQAHTHTPDTMPTGAALLALEERWLEQPNANAANGGGVEDTNDDGLDDMLWGSLVGFFWPVGVMFWLLREEGVWSRRRQLMVLLGVFINLMFGFLRLLNR